MPANLWLLYRVQQVDSQTDDLQTEIHALDPGGEQECLLQDARSALEKVTAGKREGEKLLHLKELELGTVSSEKKGVDKKLYSGTTTNPKELYQWQKDLEMLAAKEGKLEEEILGLMENNEATDRSIKAAQGKVAEAEKAYGAVREAYEAKKRELEGKLQELAEKRAKMLEGLEPDILKRYGDLREKKGGVAVARVQKNTCGGCFLTLAENLIQRARARELEFCNHCGRILFAESDSG